MRRPIFIATFIILTLLSSCATLISGSKQMVSFTSSPSAASIFINAIEVGKTPFETKLERKEEHHILIKLEGYKTYETVLVKKFNAWYLGNILFGGIIGLIIDPITGAIYKLTPAEIRTEKNKNVTIKNDINGLYIGVHMEINPNWIKVGQLEKM